MPTASQRNAFVSWQPEPGKVFVTITITATTTEAATSLAKQQLADNTTETLAMPLCFMECLPRHAVMDSKMCFWCADYCWVPIGDIETNVVGLMHAFRKSCLPPATRQLASRGVSHRAGQCAATFPNVAAAVGADDLLLFAMLQALMLGC